MKDKKTLAMAMNCKQFKHSQRVGEKVKFSFNPAEVNYTEQFSTESIHKGKPVTRDISLKRLIKIFVVIVLLAGLLMSIF